MQLLAVPHYTLLVAFDASTPLPAILAGALYISH
jgi:hypothetical protein